MPKFKLKYNFYFYTDRRSWTTEITVEARNREEAVIELIKKVPQKPTVIFFVENRKLTSSKLSPSSINELWAEHSKVTKQ